MSRIRWYHSFFALALFEVAVIMFSLHLHKQTLQSVDHVITQTLRLDEQSRWQLLAQQRILQLSAPGNHLFQIKDMPNFTQQEERLQRARANMMTTLRTADGLDLHVKALKAQIQGMFRSTDGIFADFKAIMQSSLSEKERLNKRLHAERAMSNMDDKQYQALMALSALFAKTASDRNQLLQRHEANLQARVIYERYFIAAVMLILVGVLAFGRHLQHVDRALEEQRRCLQEERRERLAAIGELCSSVAHGIRNPLASIRSSAELMLEMGQMDDGSREKVGDILNEGKRLGDRVTGLLSMARVNTSAFEQVNLCSVVISAIKELSPEFRRQRIHIEQAVSSEDIILYGDRRQLDQAVIELLSNAAEHTGPETTVHVECRFESNHRRAVVSVEDQGPGVPKEVQSRIFDLFFTTKPSGTGIGLATVKRMARLHGGDVRLSSSPCGGACLILTLPVTKENQNHDRE